MQGDLWPPHACIYIHMYVYTHVDIPKSINIHIGVTPFTQSLTGGNSHLVTQRPQVFKGRLTKGSLVGDWVW